MVDLDAEIVLFDHWIFVENVFSGNFQEILQKSGEINRAGDDTIHNLMQLPSLQV